MSYTTGGNRLESLSWHPGERDTGGGQTRLDSLSNPSLQELQYGSLDSFVPVSDNGLPSFVFIKNGGEKVRVIMMLSGSGYCDLVVLKRNGEMFQIGIAECIAPADYVDYMFDQRDLVRGPAI
jgi:hypothetical protein